MEKITAMKTKDKDIMKRLMKRLLTNESKKILKEKVHKHGAYCGSCLKKITMNNYNAIVERDFFRKRYDVIHLCHCGKKSLITRYTEEQANEIFDIHVKS